MKGFSTRSGHRSGFSLVEMLVATAVFTLILVVLLQATGLITSVWRQSSGRITAFQNARAAFDTIHRELSLATLNTYFDYVDASGNLRTAANKSTFKPANFARASELHFVAGKAKNLIPSALSPTTGSALFLQLPRGYNSGAALSSLNLTLNTVGYHVSYRSGTDAGFMPSWLQTLFGDRHSFQLLQWLQPAEDMKVYESTNDTSWDLDWLPPEDSALRPAVIADHVLLLVFLPRVSAEDQNNLRIKFAQPTWTLSPGYEYDSRAWESGYAGSIAAGDTRSLMRNQIPPIVDLVMVAADPKSLARFDLNSATPPVELVPAAGAFELSEHLESDLDDFQKKLTNAAVGYRVFRSSVRLRGSKWSQQ